MLTVPSRAFLSGCQVSGGSGLQACCASAGDRHHTLYAAQAARQVIFFFFSIPLFGLRVSLFARRFLHCTLRDFSSRRCRVCSQLHSAIVGLMCLPYLYVSGPLDFRLVIQVLFGPRMILNACIHIPDLGLTSHRAVAALPQG